MRLFFGLVLPNKTKKAINNMIDGLKERYRGKYTLMDNLHITLVFIGEVEPKVSHMLAQIGDMAFDNFEIMSIRAHDFATFKDGKIGYLAVEKSDALNNTYQALIDLLDEHNVVYNVENEYTPHITLRRGAKENIEAETDAIDIEVDTIALYESKRVDDVLRYVPIRTWSAKEK